MQLTKENILNIDKSKFKELTPDEQQAVIQILQEFRDNDGFSQTLDDMWKADYNEIPVDIMTFICDDTYLGKSTREGTSIYPFWKQKYEEIFDTNKEYLEIVLTGAIGIGKTRTVVVCLCYLLYLIMCLKNPHEFFKFNEGDEITIAFCNITLDLAEGVAFETMHNYLINSPWFMERGIVTGKKKLRYNPPNHITLSFGSNAGHFLGKQIYAALMDEVDFTRSAIKGVDVLNAQKGIMNTYTQIKERINSRFIVDGKQYGRMFLVSSKKSEHDFLESYIRKMLQEPEQAKKMLVVDEPQWIVKPTDTYSGKTFKVAVGNKMLSSYIIPNDSYDEDNLNSILAQGYTIIDIPVELKQSFVLDINTALMNLAGISVIGSTSYFNYTLFKRCYLSNVKKPFPLEILEIGLHDDKQILQFFDIDAIPDELKAQPQFIHLDTSLSGDITGITDTALTGKKRQKQYLGAEEIETTERCYRHLFSIGIKAPKGDEISLEKTRQFIYALKRLGFNIKRVSIDGFQSADTRQILETNNIPAIIISMDKLKDGEQPGYSTTRSAMNDGRVGMIQYDKLEEELVRLQRDTSTGKIDHPIDGCFTSDTKISLVDGRNLTIEELLIEQSYKTNYVYTINESTHLIEPKPIKKIFQTKLVKKLMEIELDNGEVIHCTPEHKFMLRNGQYEEIQNLSIGTSLMPLYTKYSNKGLKGYRLYYEPFECKWHYEHRRFCNNIIHCLDYIVHHCNYNKADNSPNNLICITRSQHMNIHNNHTMNYNKTSTSIKQWHKLNKNTENYKIRNNKIREKAINYYSKGDKNYKTNKERFQDHIHEIEKTFNVDWNKLSLKEKNSYGVRLSRLNNPNIIIQVSKTMKEKHLGNNWNNAHQNMHNFKWITNGIETKYINILKETLPEGFWFGRTFNKINKIEYKNHKIVSIKFINKLCRVYDLEIEDNHNFALASGVFVHNSKDIADSFAGSIYNASTYEEIDSFDLELMDVIEDINDDVDDIIKEQAILAQQISGKSFRKSNDLQLPELESLFGGSSNSNNKSSNSIEKVNVTKSDDFIFF